MRGRSGFASISGTESARATAAGRPRAVGAGQQWDKAEEHFRKAIRRTEELPHIIEQPEARRFYARMLLDRDAPGDREKARGLFTEALEMYRRIGMPKHVEMAETMVREV